MTSETGIMSGTAPQIEWYIARDGAQHGPISDVEMRKVVELGHLRPTDLVWCLRFTEWRRAADVFPPAPSVPPPPASVAPASVTPAPTPAPAPAAAPAPVSPVLSPSPSYSAPSAFTPAPRAADQPAAADPAAAAERAASPRTGPASVRVEAAPAAAAATSANSPGDDAAWAQAMRDVLNQSPKEQAAQFAGKPAGKSAADPRAASPAPASRAAGPYVAAGSELATHPVLEPDFQPHAYAGPRTAHKGFSSFEAAPRAEHEARFDDRSPPGGEAESGKPRRDWIGFSAATLAVMLVIGGLGWVTWQNRSFIGGASAIGDAIKAKVSSSPPAEAYRFSPYDAPGETRDLIDASFQRTAIWRLLKREHPEWYAERLADIERMRSQKQDEKIIQRFIADIIVTLRRRNAQTALQSSPEHLRAMARAFGDNLRQLASRDFSTCFAFITYGEANPFQLELSRTPAFAEPLQRQLVSIFEAIGNGKANRLVHAVTRRTDYDQLTKELTARGWSAADLSTFSDPARLSASPPEKVCTLVQEWFGTHLALADKELQTRLLAESLKPLVGG